MHRGSGKKMEPRISVRVLRVGLRDYYPRVEGQI